MIRSQERVTGGWRYERVEGSHWVPLDQSERLNGLLLDFLGTAIRPRISYSPPPS